MVVGKSLAIIAASLEGTACRGSEALVLQAAVGTVQSLDFSIPGTRAGQGHSVVANLASSIAVVVVERRMNSSWKVVGLPLGMHLYADASAAKAF
jgi:hypothetical protein